MIEMRTSEISPILIAEVPIPPSQGLLGLTFCPGKKDSGARWDRDLHTDVKVIRNWGAAVVLTLIEDHEFRMLKVERLEDEVRAAGMEWLHLPIIDVNVPDERFEDRWVKEASQIHHRLDRGERILIHCRGGLGRTGLVAGRIMVERGFQVQQAIRRIRAVRPHAIETRAQEAYVFGCASRTDVG